ncbi:hypothetical protein MKX03_018007 [Papaver bracteatum]|nr:hypothetical protein MKX03_018007 [Papaver bracteatum]
MNGEIILQKSEKKKHKRIKENEALSSSEVPTVMETKHKRKKEEAALSSSEVPKEKKHKKSKENEAISSSEVPTEKKKHKKNKEKEALSSSEVSTDVGGAKNVKGSDKKEGVPDNGREKGGERKNKKDKEMVMGCSDVECATDQADSKRKDHIDVTGEENDEHVKTGKGKKNQRRNENGSDSGESYIEKSGSEAQSGSRSSKKRNREEEVLDVAIGEGKKKKKTRTKLDGNIENTKTNIEDVETENNFGSTNEHLRNSGSENSSKRVKFASHVEVFPSSDDQDDREENPVIKLVRGKRFTKEEDQIIKDAVHNYIEAHELGEQGLDMILNCKKHPNIRTCWKEIGAALPYRPHRAVYERGHTLLDRGESRKWTEDEKAVILKYNQLSSSMVKEGKWADADDYRLLDELFRLDACCIEDVDWDDLLEHRPGDITLKRWRQMVNHIGIHGLQSFAEQVEVLAKRYCPELLEVREALDSRPVVD